MNFKFPRAIYFLSASAILTSFFWLNYPDQLISLAEITPSNQNEIIELEELQSNQVIYLGENHDNAEDHAQQLNIITQLQQDHHDHQLVIGMEMFQRPFQPILDRYLAQEISEQELRKQTEYDNRWGFDWEFYAPILRYAQAQQIPLIALNTPAEITRKVAETGINSLTGNDFRHIPPLPEIKLDNLEYRQAIAEVYSQHVQDGQGNSKDLDNFFAAQVLWDETMAEAIASYYQNQPQSQIVVLVGKAHVMKDYALPDRVERRIQNQVLRDIVYLL
jgi:uncharacterized iron-regulated protein